MVKEGASPAPQQVCAGGQVPPRASGPPQSPAPCPARQQTWATRRPCSPCHGDPVHPCDAHCDGRLGGGRLVQEGFCTPAGLSVQPVARTQEKTPCFSAILKGSCKGKSLILSDGKKKTRVGLAPDSAEGGRRCCTSARDVANPSWLERSLSEQQLWGQTTAESAVVPTRTTERSVK